MEHLALASEPAEEPRAVSARPKAVGDATATTDAAERAWLDGLMRSHGNKLAAYFAFRLRDEDVAQDLVIETFYRAWRSRKTFRGDAKASTWLWTIGQRVFAAHLAQKKKRSVEVLTETLPERSAAPAHEEDGEARRNALMACFEVLNERIQRSAELVWVLGHSYVEAAAILGETADTVRMRLKRARQPLQECLSEKGIVGSNA